MTCDKIVYTYRLRPYKNIIIFSQLADNIIKCGIGVSKLGLFICHAHTKNNSLIINKQQIMISLYNSYFFHMTGLLETLHLRYIETSLDIIEIFIAY